MFEIFQQKVALNLEFVKALYEHSSYKAFTYLLYTHINKYWRWVQDKDM